MTEHKEKLLIVESDSAVSSNIIEFLENFGYSSEVICDSDKIADTMQSLQYDLVVIDQHCFTDKQFSVLRTIRKYDRDVDILIMFNDPTVEMLLNLSKLGITKFIVKPFTSRELEDTVVKGISYTKQNREFRIYSESRDETLSLVKGNQRAVCSSNVSAKV